MPEFVPRRLLVTGGAGFIGGNFVRHILAAHPKLHVWNLDLLTYAGNLASLADVEAAHGESGDGRYRFVQGDIADFPCVTGLLRTEAIDTVVHFAAESHVDRSILGPEPFLTTNVLGTFRLLEACRQVWKERHDVRFHHVSTDEVYGSLGPSGAFTEDTAYDPSSPYSASKAASDHLVRAWHRTYGLPVTLTNCSNNYGPFQFPEKLIPLVILNCLEGKPLPIYGRGENIRDWLHVEDHCRAVDRVLRGGRTGATYNVGGESETSNLQVVEMICDEVDRLGRTPPGLSRCRDLITFVADRPGHDFRYAIDFSRIRAELGWQPAVDLTEGLCRTAAWYVDHRDWCAQVRSGEYRHYYERQYGRRLGEPGQ
jgi:dTDP-glucose 4,6-dehydratase